MAEQARITIIPARSSDALAHRYRRRPAAESGRRASLQQPGGEFLDWNNLPGASSSCGPRGHHQTLDWSVSRERETTVVIDTCRGALATGRPAASFQYVLWQWARQWSASAPRPITTLDSPTRPAAVWPASAPVLRLHHGVFGECPQRSCQVFPLSGAGRDQ